MSKTQELTQELTVVNSDGIKALSLPTQKLINEIAEELKMDSLNLFNPIVNTMITIEEFKELKYVPDDKESIAKYKEAIKMIRSFRASTKRAKTELKKPFIETGKKLDKFQNIFVDRATDVEKVLVKEFDDYLKQEEAKKKAREDKKNKAAIDKIEELSDEATKQKLVISRMQLKQKLDKELATYVPDAVSKAKTFSKDALFKEIEDLKELQEAGFTLEEQEKATLLPEQQEEIVTTFRTNIESAIHILKAEYYKELPKENQLKAPVSVEELEVIDESVIDMVAPSITQENPDFFKDAICDILIDAIENIENLNPANPKETSVKAGTIIGLQKIEQQIINYLSDGQENPN